MGKKRNVPFFCSLLLISVGSCVPIEPEFTEVQDVIGYVPVYGTEAASEIVMSGSRTIENPGKIYVYGKYLLVNEIRRGIHVFDNTNPAEPVPVGFMQLLGNSEMAIKDDVLYADQMGSLVALRLNDFMRIEERGRLPLNHWNLGVPPPAGFYFECADPAEGLVVTWQKARLHNPQCYALQ
jgi:hypothetical protein